MMSSGSAGVSGGLDVALSPADDLPALEAQWRRLEQSGHVSFFLSWNWVGTLIETLPPEARPRILTVRQDGECIALGLFGSAVERRRRFIRSRTLHLNETGQADFDALTIEHNGLAVADRDRLPAVLQAVMAELRACNSWDELYVSGLDHREFEQWRTAALASGLSPLVRWEKEYHFVDLELVRAQAGGYLSGLSSNTRHQIRRAMKIYAGRGPLEYRLASSLAEAHAWLQALVDVHQVYWQAQGQPGAFGSDYAREFHRRLVDRAWPDQGVEVARVDAGDHVVGYLYNFRKDGSLYNYQSGLTYEPDARLKPGLVCHALAAEDASRRGLACYDLLMGGGHYKRRLANGSGRMLWCSIQQRRLALRLENRLRDLASRYGKRPPPAGGDRGGED